MIICPNLTDHGNTGKPSDLCMPLFRIEAKMLDGSITHRCENDHGCLVE